MKLDDKSLHVLSFDTSLCPQNAAGVAELLPFVRNVRTDGDRVIVHFDQGGAASVLIRTGSRGQSH